MNSEEYLTIYGMAAGLNVSPKTCQGSLERVYTISAQEGLRP
jgi:hypothetical protein